MTQIVARKQNNREMAKAALLSLKAKSAQINMRQQAKLYPKVGSKGRGGYKHRIFSLNLQLLLLKGTGSRNQKQICYLYNLYCCPHVAIVFYTDFGG